MLPLWGSAICCGSWSSCCSSRRSLQWRWSAEGWKTDWIWSDLQCPEDQWWTWWVGSLMIARIEMFDLQTSIWADSYTYELLAWPTWNGEWWWVCVCCFPTNCLLTTLMNIFLVMIDPHSDINRILDKVPDSNSISNVQVKQHVHQLLI